MATSLDFTAPVVDIKEDVNDDLTITIAPVDGNGSPINLTSWGAMTAGVWDHQPNAEETGSPLSPLYPPPLVSFGVTGTSTRVAKLTQAQKEALGVGKWWYKIEIDDPAGDLIRLQHGLLILEG